MGEARSSSDRSAADRVNALSPFSLVVLFVVAGVLVPLYPFLQGIDGFSLFWPYDYIDKNSSTLYAVAAYALAVALFGFQYHASHRTARTISPLTYQLSPRNPTWPLVVFLVPMLALAATTLLAKLLGGFDQLLAGAADRTRAFAGLNFLLLPQNALISVALAWALMVSRARPLRLKRVIPLLCYCIVSIGIIALQGSKATLFVFVVTLSIVYHYRVKRISLLKVLLGGAILFVALIAFHIFKQEYLAIGEVVSLDPGDRRLDAVLAILGLQWTGNLMQLQCLATLIDGMPGTLDFQYGKTLLMIALILVPSALYPAKPLTAPGILTDAFWPHRWVDEGTTMPPGFVGEMYMNFGWVGIAAGALLAGHVYGASMRRCEAKPNCDRTLGSHALLVAVMLHFFRGELASVCLLFFSIYVPFLIVCKACSVVLPIDRGQLDARGSLETPSPKFLG